MWKKFTQRFALVGSFLLFSVLISCDTSEIDPEKIDSGSDYYPIAVGNFWVYAVDTTEYAFSGAIRKGRYFMKEIVSDTLPDQEGARVFRLEIYRTTDTTKAWQIDSVWTVRVGKDKIIKTENNRPFVKLLFPLREGSRWDGNQYNPLQDSNSVYWYTVRDLGKTTQFNNQNVPSVEIAQKIDSNCINLSYFTEIYFKNIGLGYRRKRFLEYDSCNVATPKIEQGKDIIYTLLSFGKQ